MTRLLGGTEDCDCESERSLSVEDWWKMPPDNVVLEEELGDGYFELDNTSYILPPQCISLNVYAQTLPSACIVVA